MENILVLCFKLMLFLSVPAVSSYPWEQCDLISVPGCTCWDPDRPVISCAKLNLTQVPLVFQQSHPEWPTIAALDLSYNSFHRIPTFGSSIRIEHLVISHNRYAFDIENLVEGLRKVDLSHNHFTKFPDAIKHHPTLEEVNLAENALPSFEGISELDNVMKLMVNGNPINKVLSRNVRFPYHLQELFVSTSPPRSNALDALNKIQGTQQLTHLVISASFIGDIERSSFNEFENLQLLSLTNCGLIDEYFSYSSGFYNLQSLNSLCLSHNFLTSIPKRPLRNLPGLKVLDLNGNMINRIRRSDLQEFTSIEVLDLSDNMITSISPRTFNGLTSITSLHLASNQLRNLPTFGNMEVEHVSLADNPWHCDCAISWIVAMASREIKQGQPGPLSVYDIEEGFRCNAPDDFVNKTIMDLTNDLYYISNCRVFN